MNTLRHKGVTLVELMVVIAIVAILVGLAIPSLTVYFEKARLRGAADDVVALLAEARQNAVMQNKRVAISFGGAGTTWCVGANPALDPAAPGDPIPAAVACDCTAPATCGLRAVSAVNYSGVSRTSAVAAAVVFDPKLGTLENLNTRQVQLQSSSGDFQLQININPIGQARTCRPAGTGIITGYPAC